MKKRIKIFSLLISIFTLSYSILVFADSYETLEKMNVKQIGDTIIRKNQTIENKTFQSDRDYENSILIKGCKVTLKNPIVKKSGGRNNDVGKEFGVNSAILTIDKSSLNLDGGKIESDGEFANGLYSYLDSNIIIRDSYIKTLKPHSSALMVNGEGKISGSNLSVVTLGSLSPAISTIGSGGNIILDKGSYTTSGINAPVIESSSNVEVSNAILKANKSQAIVLDGTGTISLDKVNLQSTDLTSARNYVHKNIFIYQSGEKGTKTNNFKSKKSTITTNQGTTFFVTNTNSIIDLLENTFVTKTTEFLKVLSDEYGNKDNNGGNVTLNMRKQKVSGNITVDKLSTLSMNLTDKSFYRGIINGNNTANNISVTLDSDSKIVLDNDSYITSLVNENNDNSNIYLNGHKLFVNGKEIVANDKYIEKDSRKNTKKEDNSYFSNIIKTIIPILKGTAALFVVIAIIMFFVYLNNRRHNKIV